MILKEWVEKGGIFYKNVRNIIKVVGSTLSRDKGRKNVIDRGPENQNYLRHYTDWPYVGMSDILSNVM